MSVQSKFECLQKAFTDLGCKCSVTPSETEPHEADFTLQKGEATVEFKASAAQRRNPLSVREVTLTVDAENRRMRFPFGHKNPDGVKYRFYLTGFKREEGEDPKSFNDRLEAKQIAAKIHEKLAL